MRSSFDSVSVAQTAEVLHDYPFYRGLRDMFNIAKLQSVMPTRVTSYTSEGKKNEITKETFVPCNGWSYGFSPGAYGIYSK